MTLVRLTRYLVDQGYTVVPDRSFRPAADTHYKKLCDSFNQMINANSAATSTKNISFLLVKVLMDGRPVCQILRPRASTTSILNFQSDPIQPISTKSRIVPTERCGPLWLSRIGRTPSPDGTM